MRCLLAGLVMALISAEVAADPRYNEADLSTLMSSREARMDIDNLRQGNKTTDGQAKKTRSSGIRIDGIIKNSKGKSTVWVNGKHNLHRNTIDGMNVPTVQKHRDAVVLYVDGEMVKLKPGESLSEEDVAR